MAGRQALYDKFDAQYKDSKAWQAAYAAVPQSACNLRGGKSMCSSETSAGDSYAQLVLATSPAAYSSLDDRWTGGRMLLTAARNQGTCTSCVAHVVVQAAEVRAGRGAGQGGGSLRPGGLQLWHGRPGWARAGRRPQTSRRAPATCVRAA
jgi:hypothetical protein